ncbi:hypothetical protein, partial [Cellulophaga sp. BC115SP]|uniref:hypothetical protein n=1 Tax=Cellulophaga sp. BC115SP TaxID=2683263 RepID=UPI001411EC77
IYDQYKQTKDLSKVNYNQATLRAATTAVIAGLLNSGLSFSKFSLSSSALFGTKLAWLRPNLFANLMTLTRAERTQLADALQSVSDDVLTRLENSTFFADFSKAILVSGSTPSSGILSSVSRVQSWVNSWLGIKDKALKWVRSTTLTGTLGIMTLTGTPQVEARIIDNSGIIETVMRVPNVASGLINGNSSEISSIVSQASVVAEVNTSQILDQTGKALSSSSGTYEVLQSTINSVQNILVRLKTSSTTSTQPIVLIKDGKTYKIGDDSKCVYCGKTVLKPASGEDNTEYTLCQDLNTLQARGGTNGTAGVSKLCSAFPTVASLRPIVTKLLSFTSGEVQKFFGDIISTSNLGSNVGSITVAKLSAWQYLYSKHSDNAAYARNDMSTLENFGKLNDNVKEYIVKFSDASVTNSSLKKFCADLTKPLETGSTVQFLDYVNDANNFTVVKKMVSHKLTAEEFEEVGEEYQIETSLVGLAKTWVDRSDKLVELKQNGEDGRFYGKRAVVALLKNSLNLGIADIDQSQYKVFNEVQLWVDKTKDQYMIADILLVKFNDDGTRILDVIICESKLSAGTDYTKRQKQGWRLIHEGKALEVKVDANSATIQQTYPPSLGKTAPQINAGTFLNINNSKYKRISDAGSKDGGFSISTIPISNYSTYQAKN